jgi:leader peptidase (prepilin peptidase)/N-methyltransferase
MPEPVTAAGPAEPSPLSSAWLRSPALIAGTVILAAVVAAVQGSLPLGVLRGLLVLVLVPCTITDLERRIIPNRITGPAAVGGLLLGLALDPGHEPRRLVWAAVAGGFLLIASLAYPAGMGMGDVKLLAVMGLLLGAPVVVALLIALLGNIFTGAYLAARRGIAAARKTALPFGPYLALGGIVAALAGNPILHAYLSLHH